MYCIFDNVGLLTNRGYVVNNQDEQAQRQAESPSTPVMNWQPFMNNVYDKFIFSAFQISNTFGLDKREFFRIEGMWVKLIV